MKYNVDKLTIKWTNEHGEDKKRDYILQNDNIRVINKYGVILRKKTFRTRK